MIYPRFKFLACSLAVCSGGWVHGAELSLVQAMQEAMTRYPAVQATQSQRASALAEVDKAEAARWPVLSMGAAAMQSSASHVTTRSATPQASYTLYAGGGIEAGVDRARHLLRSADGKVSATQDEVAQQAGEAYLMWARALSQLALARQNLQLLEQIRADVATIVEVDKGRLVDLNQAVVRVQSAKLTVTQREMELEQARLRLNRYVLTPMPQQPAGLDAMASVTAQTLAQAQQAVEDAHPAMVQALAQVEAARAGVEVAKAQMYPKVDVSVARQANPYSLTTQTLSQVTLNMPVFNGGAGQASVRAAVEQLQAAQSGLEEQATVLRERIGVAWTEWQAAGQRVELSVGQARSGEELVDNYRAQFRLARRSLLDLLNVQNEVYGYQAAAVHAKFDVRINTLKLVSAMGQLVRRIGEVASLPGGH